MSNLLLKIKAFFVGCINCYQVKRAKKLPQGVKEFGLWSDSLIKYYGLPDNDSVRFMLATMILHAKEDAAFLSQEYFGKRALKSAANQVAAGIMQDLKSRQEAKIAEEKAAKDATVNPSGAV